MKWHQQGNKSLEKFFNVNGTLYRTNELALKVPNMSQEEMAQWLGNDGMLVKRPLLIGNDFVLNGFAEEEWEKFLV